MRKKFTPLQKISLRDRGNPNTTLEEELREGITAMGYLREKGNVQLLDLVSMYVVLSTQIKVTTGNARAKLFREFRVVSGKLFKLAHKLGVFTDARVAMSAFIQSTDYLLANPDGDLAPLAKTVLKQLDDVSSYGSVPRTSYSNFSNPWLLIAVLISIYCFTGRSV